MSGRVGTYREALRSCPITAPSTGASSGRAPQPPAYSSISPELPLGRAVPGLGAEACWAPRTRQSHGSFTASRLLAPVIQVVPAELRALSGVTFKKAVATCYSGSPPEMWGELVVSRYLLGGPVPPALAQSLAPKRPSSMEG